MTQKKYEIYSGNKYWGVYVKGYLKNCRAGYCKFKESG